MYDTQGSIVSAIGAAINAVISAIANVIETIVSAIVTVRRPISPLCPSPQTMPLVSEMLTLPSPHYSLGPRRDLGLHHRHPLLPLLQRTRARTDRRSDDGS